MAGPIGALDEALYNKLNVSAVTDLLGGEARIYKSVAPAGVSLPYVLYEHVSGGDENVTPSRTRNVVYTVKAVATTAAGAEEIDEQIDAQLHRQILSVTGWQNFWLVREEDMALAVEVDGGGVHHHVGAQYRIRIGKTT